MGLTSNHPVDDLSERAKESHIRPVEEWVTGALVTAYESRFGLLHFRISPQFPLHGIVQDDGSHSIIEKDLFDGLNDLRSYPLAVIVSVCQSESFPGTDVYPGLQNLVNKLAALELDRLNKVNENFAGDPDEIGRNRFFLTVLNRIRSPTLSLIDRVAIRTVNGTSLITIVPGKAVKARMFFLRASGLGMGLHHLFRHHGKTWADIQFASSFESLNEYVYFKSQEMGVDAGQILDPITEIAETPWNDDWMTEWHGTWEDDVVGWSHKSRAYGRTGS